MKIYVQRHGVGRGMKEKGGDWGGSLGRRQQEMKREGNWSASDTGQNMGICNLLPQTLPKTKKIDARLETPVPHIEMKPSMLPTITVTSVTELDH